MFVLDNVSRSLTAAKSLLLQRLSRRRTPWIVQDLEAFVLPQTQTLDDIGRSLEKALRIEASQCRWISIRVSRGGCDIG